MLRNSVLAILASGLVCIPFVAHAQGCVQAGPRVALTFDDGPRPRVTQRVLGVLDNRGVKGTFFMVGSQLRANPAVARKVWAEGHELGLHSDNHARLDLLSAGSAGANLSRNLLAMRKAVPEATIHFWRAPYGALPTGAGASAIRAALPGVRHAAWTVDTLDWTPHKSRDAFLANFSPRLRRRNIILVHDRTQPVQKWLGEAVDMLRARGAVFVTMSEMDLPTCKGSVAPAVEAKATDPAKKAPPAKGKGKPAPRDAAEAPAVPVVPPPLPPEITPPSE